MDFLKFCENATNEVIKKNNEMIKPNRALEFLKLTNGMMP